MRILQGAMRGPGKPSTGHTQVGGAAAMCHELRKARERRCGGHASTGRLGKKDVGICMCMFKCREARGRREGCMCAHMNEQRKVGWRKY